MNGRLDVIFDHQTYIYLPVSSYLKYKKRETNTSFVSESGWLIFHLSNKYHHTPAVWFGFLTFH